MEKIAVVFPGQGSQSVGMLADVGDQPCVQMAFQEASQALGYDLWELVQQGPESTLNQTLYTQPALLTAGVAVWRLWKQHKQESPMVLAGHSLGEYTALVAAEALSLEVAVQLVSERGRLMQEAVPEGKGAMAALLGLKDEEVRELCLEASQEARVSPANYNCPGQVVIAGESEAVNHAIRLAKQKGAKRAILLPVSVPSHCELMREAAEQFAALLSEVSFQVPRLPILHNVDLQPHQRPQAIREALKAQLYQPVRWGETIQKMQAMGVETILECGPGQVLTGLNWRIAPDLECAVINQSEVLCS